MKYRKMMAVALAATMAMGSSVVAFAEEGGATGEGKLEGTVNTDVFDVVLPTVATDGSTLAFTLDPEGLISKTNSAAYSGKTFGTGTLFFANDGGTTDYSNTSDSLVVTNKSSVKADVTVTAKITGNDGIALTDDKTFADDSSASMYMAIVDAVNTEGVAIGDNGATVTAQIAEAPTGAYEYTWDATNGYQYALVADTTGIDFATYEFQLTGAANEAGDWSALADVIPQVELTWNVVAHSDAPAITGSTSYTAVADTAVEVGVTLGSGDTAATGIASVTYTNKSGAEVAVASGTGYTYENGILVLTETTVNAFLSATSDTRNFTITFNDSASTAATITLTK